MKKYQADVFYLSLLTDCARLLNWVTRVFSLEIPGFWVVDALGKPAGNRLVLDQGRVPLHYPAFLVGCYSLGCFFLL